MIRPRFWLWVAERIVWEGSWLGWWQRWTRGFSDASTLSLDYSLARLILPRLRRFIELKTGHPPRLTAEEWEAALAKMERAFSLVLSSAYWMEDEEVAREVDEGLRLFALYYRDLWR